MNYCEFPIWGGGECGQPACAKIGGAWFCVLHEDSGERLLEAAAREDEALDSLLDDDAKEEKSWPQGQAQEAALVAPRGARNQGAEGMWSRARALPGRNGLR